MSSNYVNSLHWKFKHPLILYIPFSMVLFVLLSEDLHAQFKQDTLFINSTDKYPIYKHLYIYQATRAISSRALFNSIPSQEFKLLAPRKSFNNSSSVTPYYWLVLTVKNNLKTDLPFYYWLNSPGLHSVKAYKKGLGDTSFNYIGESGYYVPRNKRQNKGFDVEFGIFIKKGETTIILLCINNPQATNAFFAPEFADYASYRHSQTQYFSIIGIIVGIMITGFLLNIVFAFSLKEKIHFLYAGYIAAILFEILTLEGVTTTYLDYFFSSKFTDIVAHSSPPVFAILMTLILQWFVGLNRSNSHFKLFTDIGIFVLGAFICFYLGQYFIDYTPYFNNKLQMALAASIGIQIMLIMLAASERAYHGSRAAWVYLGATLWVLFGIIQHVFVYLGFDMVESIRIRRPNDVQLGLVIEAIVVFVAIIYRYNFYKKEKEKLLIEVNEHQQQLLYAEEEERKRIGELLHDEVSATLSTLNLHISNLPNEWKSEPAAIHYYMRALTLSHKAANEIRDISHNLLLVDLQANGLFQSLQIRINDLNALKLINYQLVIVGEEASINSQLWKPLYLIINELLMNILKHSVASEASIQLLVDDNTLLVMVEDNGVGFDSTIPRNGIGLKHISNRINFLQGSFKVDSNQSGTTIVINLPLLS